MSIKLLKANGLDILKIMKVHLQATSLNTINSIAYLQINVGKQFVNCNSIISVSMDSGTPYNQIKNIACGYVDEDGLLKIEVYGNDFVIQHTFVLNILLYK